MTRSFKKISNRLPGSGAAAILVALIAVPVFMPAKAQADVTVSPRAADACSGEIDFDVMRNGNRVGYHEVTFERNGNDCTVRSRFHLEVGLLFITAYRFNYESVGHWRDGQLSGLQARVDDNGARSEIEAVRNGDKMVIRNGRQVVSASLPLYPTTHWNPGVIGQSRVLNTLTGKVDRVSLEPVDREPVETERGKIMATRYQYTGDLSTDVWYDDLNRWVKMRFKGKDGSTIEYVCRKCQGGGGGVASVSTQ